MPLLEAATFDVDVVVDILDDNNCFNFSLLFDKNCFIAIWTLVDFTLATNRQNAFSDGLTGEIVRWRHCHHFFARFWLALWFPLGNCFDWRLRVIPFTAIASLWNFFWIEYVAPRRHLSDGFLSQTSSSAKNKQMIYMLAVNGMHERMRMRMTTTADVRCGGKQTCFFRLLDCVGEGEPRTANANLAKSKTRRRSALILKMMYWQSKYLNCTPVAVRFELYFWSHCVTPTK